MLEELVNIGKMMMQQAQEPSKPGSVANVSESRPQSAMGGQFGGAAADQTAGMGG
jgi:hypothetical protein